MDINEAAQAMTGTWQKLTRKADGVIKGRVISFEQRPMTFEGSPVLSRKTGAQRTEWVLAVQDDDNQVIKFSLKESGQRAVSEAIKASGKPAKNGDVLTIAVKTDPAKDTEQPVYKATWEADNTPLDIPTAQDDLEDEEPF